MKSLLVIIIFASFSSAQNVLSYVGATQQHEGGIWGLHGANSVAVSSDGKSVYVVSSSDGRIVTFNRDLQDGSLNFNPQLQLDNAGVKGLYRATSVTVSPDGNSVYVTSSNLASIASFSRNPEDGSLSYDTCRSLNEMEGASCVAVSPDNKSVYVTGSLADAVAIFDRNLQTGSLTRNCSFSIFDMEGLFGLRRAKWVTVSHDNKSVYVMPNSDACITIFDRDPATCVHTLHGIFKQEGMVEGLNMATCIAVSPDDKDIYVTSADSSLVMFRRDTQSGDISWSNGFYRGRYNTEYQLAEASCVAVSPDNKNVYVAVLRGSSISVFNRDADVDSLIYGSSFYHSDLSYVASVAVSPDNKNVYAAAGSAISAGGIVVTNRDPLTGNLTLNESIWNGKWGVRGIASPGTIIASPDNRHVYTAGSDSAIGIFYRAPGSGELVYDSCFTDKISTFGNITINSMAISPDGKNIYVCPRSLPAVVVLNRNADSGTLSYADIQINGQDSVKNLSAMSFVTVSPDNGSVYVVTPGTRTIVAFNRTTSTGLLKIRQVLQQERDSAACLEGACHLIVSPDGKNVYIAADRDDAVSIFTRNYPGGMLEYAGCVKDGQNGVDGMDSVIAICISPDNKNLYAVSAKDSAIAIFGRDASNGALSYVSNVKCSQSEAFFKNRPTSLVASPDNNYIYVATSGSKAVSAFSRDIATGTLSAVGDFIPEKYDTAGWQLKRLVIVSPDNKNVYIASEAVSCVSSFKVQYNTALSQEGIRSVLQDKMDFIVVSDNAHCTVKFNMPFSGRVELSLLNVNGRLIQKVFSRDLEAGTNVVKTDLSGVPSGVYFMRLSAGSERMARKIIIGGNR